MKFIKKLFSVLCVLSLLWSIAGCTANQAETSSGLDSSEQNTPSVDSSGADIPIETNEKVLVAYFSCTNTTEGIAELIAEETFGTLFEIVPEDPYTDADLNYNNSNSRATKEQNDSSIRPAITQTVDDMEQYNVIFLGYPIWWGQAPRIISTFLESYDFSGKNIIPFCTSHSSGIG